MSEPRLRHPEERPEPGRTETGLTPRIATGTLRLRGDVGELCRIVAEEDVMSAARAIDLLADLGDRAATDTLLACLEDRESLYYKGFNAFTGRAAVALGTLREPLAVPALIALLAERPDVPGPIQDDAAHALGLIGDPRGIPALLAAAANRTEFAGTPAAEPALTALGRFDPDLAVPALLAHLWEYLADRRGPIAVRVLGELGSPAAVPALTYLVTTQDRQWDLHRAAAQALSMLTDLTDVPNRLWVGLRDPDPWTANAVAEVFARSGLGRTWLESQLPYGDPVMRQSVCHGLGVTGDPAAVPVLAERVRTDTSVGVRRAAAAALRAIGGPAVPPALLEALGDRAVSDIVTGALAAVPEPPVPELLDVLEHGGPHRRSDAARALGMIGDARAGAPLLGILPGAVGRLRMAVVDALGALRYRPACRELVAIARHGEEPVALRARAVRAAGACGERELPLRALGDAAEPIRLHAVEVLVYFPDDEVVAALASLIGTDTLDVQRAALRSLGELGRHAQQTLFAMLGRVDGEVRGWVAAQLSRCATTSGIPALAELAFDRDRGIALAAVEALASLDDPAIIDPLIDVLCRQHPTHWYGVDPRHETATRALARFQDDRAVAAIADHAMTVCSRQARVALTEIASR